VAVELTELTELSRAAADLEHAPPVDIVRWAHDRFGEKLVVTASFGDAVLSHVASTAVPGIEIVLLDTQYLHAETLWFADQLRRSLDMNLCVVRPANDVQPDNLWAFDTDACCALRKVEPLDRALRDRDAWVSGVRRADSTSRVATPVVTFDIGRGVVKVNPLAALSDDDIELYQQLHDLPRNPLTDRGYPSIGCWPCTRPVAAGDDPRSGRWAGSAKTECGLHA
jgi:phosphoadenosine phosphosulfate reductase